MLWERATIGNLKINLIIDPPQPHPESTRYEVDLLSNDVENILIEEAFKIQKFNRNRFDMVGPYLYEMITTSEHSPYYPYPQQCPSFTTAHMNFNQQQMLMNNYQHAYMHPNNFVSEDSDLYELRRSSNYNNLV
jgi:hypothetical protein